MKVNDKKAHAAVKMQNRKTEEKKNEVIINRLIITFGFAIAIVFSFFGMNNLGTVGYLLDPVVPYVFIGAAGILFVFALILFIIRRTRRIDERLYSFNSMHLLGLTVVPLIFYCVTYFNNYNMGNIPLLIAITVILTLLYFIYYLYQRVYFLLSIFIAASAVMLYISGKLYSGSVLALVLKIAVIAIAVKLVVFQFIISKNKGCIDIKGRKIRVYSEDSAKWPPYCVAAVILACAVLSFLGSAFTIYAVAVFIAAFLLTGIYYTIKVI